uniref:Uncharacterized protein n=1 Tax=Anopheles atroparvus TaxID=41427 RepID=A0A182JJ22_ANOAO
MFKLTQRKNGHEQATGELDGVTQHPQQSMSIAVAESERRQRSGRRRSHSREDARLERIVEGQPAIGCAGAGARSGRAITGVQQDRGASRAKMIRGRSGRGAAGLVGRRLVAGSRGGSESGRCCSRGGRYGRRGRRRHLVMVRVGDHLVDAVLVHNRFVVLLVMVVLVLLLLLLLLLVMGVVMMVLQMLLHRTHFVVLRLQRRLVLHLVMGANPLPVLITVCRVEKRGGELGGAGLVGAWSWFADASTESAFEQDVITEGVLLLGGAPDASEDPPFVACSCATSRSDFTTPYDANKDDVSDADRSGDVLSHPTVSGNGCAAGTFTELRRARNIDS